MRSANNHATANSGRPMSSASPVDALPRGPSRGTNLRPDRLADIAHSKLEELIVTL